jgi:hypothetical protein
MSKGAWDVSTISMLSALQKEPVVDGVALKDLKYTILDNENVVFRDSQELAELHSIDPKKPPKDYVAYRPERMALHEIVIAVSTQLKLSDETQIQKMVKEIYSEVLKDLDISALNEARKALEKDLTLKVDKYLSQELPAQDRASIIFSDVEKSMTEFGKYVPDYTKEKAMAARATDILFAEFANQQISSLVSKKIEKYEGVQLDIPSEDSRLMLMVCGGQASGKGSSVAILQKSAIEQGVAWENVVKVNTDSYKSLLLQPGTVKPELYSQLAQDEASSINQGIQKRLKMMAEKGKAPHIFIDQVFVGPDQINLGLMNQGKVRGIVVSTDVRDSVERSYARGAFEGEKGRYENTHGILRCHKMMTEQLPNTLAKYSGQDVQFILVDNNVAKGELPQDVMLFDMLNKNMIMNSPEKLQDFIKKCSINPNAKESGQLYLGNSKMPMEYLSPLINAGTKLNMSEEKDIQKQIEMINKNTP